MAASDPALDPSPTSDARLDLLPMSLLRSALSAVLQSSSPSPFELVFRSTSSWPFPSKPTSSPRPGSARPTELKISCLDSSFNPPTRAHLALATAPNPSSETGYGEAEAGGEYDGHLLLLSVKNVDKVLQTGDATYEQRLQMIHLIAQDIQDLTSSMATAAGAPASWKNFAIGLLSEPAFINKDKVIRRYLSEQQRSARGEEVSFKLCWLVGTDTVERFFDQKYYSEPLDTCLPPFFSPRDPSQAPSELIHFPRPTSTPTPPSTSTRTPLYESTIASLGLPSRSVRVGRTRGDEDWGRVSSTEVRKGVARGDGLWCSMTGERVAAFIKQEGLYTV